MKAEIFKPKKIILFQNNLTVVGGSVREMFEEARFFERNGVETHVLCFDFEPEGLFNGGYKVNIDAITKKSRSKNRFNKNHVQDTSDISFQ